MSSALAIASVTYVLKDLLNNGLSTPILSVTDGNFVVTAVPPDLINLSTQGQCQINLYMYRVTFNQGWKNVALPGFDNQGERVSNPPLALDLHYLLTSYGLNNMQAEELMGYGMQLLHERPILDRKAIRNSFTNANTASGGNLPEGFITALSMSELEDQIEQIKIIPENLSTDELSKLWTAFGSKYRPSAAYQVSVVLIESKKSIKTSLPVLHRNLYVNPFHQPVIEKIKSQKASEEPIVEDQPIFAGYNLVITGRLLKSEDVRVSVGGQEVEPAKEKVSDSEILIQLPAGLKAGVQTVYVIHRKLMGSAPYPHRGVESNIAVFVLSPRIIFINPSSPPSNEFVFTTEPAVTDTQRVTLILNEFPKEQASEQSLSYSLEFPALPHTDPPTSTNEIPITISGVKSGDYVARIRVDGAVSPLEIDSKGNYCSPKLSILP